MTCRGVVSYQYMVVFLVLCFSLVKLFESIKRFDHYTAVIISDLK